MNEKEERDLFEKALVISEKMSRYLESMKASTQQAPLASAMLYVLICKSLDRTENNCKELIDFLWEQLPDPKKLIGDEE